MNNSNNNSSQRRRSHRRRTKKSPMKSSPLSTPLLLIGATAFLISQLSCVTADGGGAYYYGDDAYKNNNNNAANDDDAAAANNNYGGAYDDVTAAYHNGYATDDMSYADASNPYAADGSILYWTNFAIFPKRCVHWNDIDQIKFDMYEKSANHCSDKAMGTYMTPVSTFVNAYLNQLVANAQDEGDEDFVVPEYAASYAQCAQGPVINGVQHYLQVGCSDTNPLALAVNIYEDDQCTTSISSSSTNNDANIEIDITLPFQKCTPCVIWMDKNDDEVDDQYYVNKQLNAPLCSTAWEYKEDCNGRCQKKTQYTVREGWNKADQVLLTILSLFGEFLFCVFEMLG